MSEITINKEEYNNLVEIKEEFNKTVKKLDDLIIENVTLKSDKDKYYKMTLDDEIQMNNLFKEIEVLNEKLQVTQEQFEEYNRLKAENEELRSDNSMLLAQGDADAFVISNLNFKIQKLQLCLYEIEEILNIYFDDDWKATREIEKLIKQAKEGEKE